MKKVICFFIGHKWGESDFWGYLHCKRCEACDVDYAITLPQIVRPIVEVIKSIGVFIARRVRRPRPEIPFPPPEHCNCRCTSIYNEDDIPF